MKTNKKRPARKPQKFSFILSICLLLLVGYFAISLINVHMQINDRKNEVKELDSEYEEQLADNKELSRVIDGGDKEEYIERIAREKLGYVMPGERVYYNITPNN